MVTLLDIENSVRSHPLAKNDTREADGDSCSI
jgi:hypothetical protein